MVVVEEFGGSPRRRLKFHDMEFTGSMEDSLK
jgi:hypothetical protein